MFAKTLIAVATALAISPAIAFAAPAITTVKTKPAVVKEEKEVTVEKTPVKHHPILKKTTITHKHTKTKVAPKI